MKIRSTDTVAYGRSMLRPYGNVCVLILMLLLAALLIGQRMGFRFAGGSGYEPTITARVTAIEGTAMSDAAGNIRALQVGDILRRGEIVRTDADSRIKLAVGSASIALDERTDLELVSLSLKKIVLNERRGRSYVTTDRDLIVQTDRVRSHISSGSLSVVHYDFKQNVDVFPVHATVDIVSDNQTVLSSTEGVHIQYLDHVTAKETGQVDLSAGAATDFYTWAMTHYPLSPL